MAAKKDDIVKFEYNGKQFEAVKSQLTDYEVNKMFAVGGNAFYIGAERIFNGKDVEYSKTVGGDFESMVGLVNAAFASVGEAKN